MKNTQTEYYGSERMPVVLPEMEQLLPPLSAEQFSALESDILENGYYAPIVVNEDMVNLYLRMINSAVVKASDIFGDYKEIKIDLTTAQDEVCL